MINKQVRYCEGEDAKKASKSPMTTPKQMKQVKKTSKAGRNLKKK